MKKTIIDYIDTYNKSIDNDSIVYFFDSGYAFAISRERVLERRPVHDYNNVDGFQFFDDILRPNSHKIKNVLYKNNDGRWIKMFLLLKDNPYSSDIFSVANNPEKYTKYEISEYFIPEVDFLDRNGNVYRISDKDNTNKYIKKQITYIDENDSNMVKLSQFSIENPNYGFDLRHMMNDLRIEIKDKSIDINNILVNLNGLFVEPIKLSAFPNSLFIKNARWTYRTIKGALKENAQPIATKTGFGPTATVTYDESDYYNNFSINVKLFQWKDVSISSWIHVEHVNYELAVAEFKNVRIMKSLVFSKELDPNRTLIICDGMIMDPSDYQIDGKTLYLKHTVNDFNRLYYEFKSKNIKNALNDALKYVNNRYYNAIEFSDIDPNKKLFIRKSSPLEKGFLGYNTVLFSTTPSSNDLILVDGTYLKYELLPNSLIRFPKFYDDNLYFREDYYPFSERKIIKMELVNYATTTLIGE